MARKPPKRSPIDTDEYRELRKVWAQKLKDSGFEDIEMIDKTTGMPGDRLHGVSPGDLRRSSHRIRQVRDQERFYALCRQYLHEIPKTAVMPRRIWAMYAEGETKIGCWRALRDDPDVETPTKAYVYRVIDRFVEDIQVEALRAPVEEKIPEDVLREVWGASQGWQA